MDMEESQQKTTKTKLPDNKQVQNFDAITQILTDLATVRQAVIGSKVLKTFAERLLPLKLDDIREGCKILESLPRKDGETAFPSLGAILSVIDMAQTARHNRELAKNMYHQQQVCPKCGGVTEMMRPRGEQFRTWCDPCQSYRKIVPEDLELTAGQWNMICAELDILYRDWKRRGSKPSECVDPQFDRKNVEARP